MPTFRFFSRLILLSGCLVLQWNCSKAAPTEAADQQPLQILFIGSSYLAYGETDVVDTLVAFADRGGRSLSVGRRILSGYRLQQHAQNVQTLAAIDADTWDVVVIQGSGLYLARPEWHDDIFPHLSTLATAVRDRSPDAQILYMMPWAFKDGLQWLEGETATYEQMQSVIDQVSVEFADSLAMGVAPVGLAWQRIIASDYENDLFLPDLSHPSTYGAYLTACVLYVTLFGEVPPTVEFTSSDDLTSYPPLIQMALDTVMDDRPRWNLSP